MLIFPGIAATRQTTVRPVVNPVMETAARTWVATAPIHAAPPLVMLSARRDSVAPLRYDQLLLLSSTGVIAEF